MSKSIELMDSVRTFVVLGIMMLFIACGDRLSTSSCTQTNVVESNAPIPQSAYAGDTEIIDHKVSSGSSADERGSDSETFSGNAALEEPSDTHNTEDTSGAGSEDSVNLPNTAARVFHLSKRLILLIDNKEASILDKSEILCKNETLIRLQDENGNCFSDGFRSVNVVAGGFELLQQNCGGCFFIMETSEFKYTPRADAVYLTKFVLEYVDKCTDAHESKFYRITSKDFGKIRFEQVNWEQLYNLAWTKAEKIGKAK